MLIFARSLEIYTAHGRDGSVASGRAAACRGATPAGCPAGAGVPDLAGKGGHQPLGPGRFAFRTSDGDLFFTAPEEEVESLSALPAFEFINRHESAPCSEDKPLDCFFKAGVYASFDINGV